jgi:SAM-dependent methyltransferase
VEAGAWNAGAKEWAAHVRGHGDGPEHAHDAVIRELLPPPAGLTVDVGCGEGRWTRELAERGYDVVGVDRSDGLVAEARKADPQGRYEIADAGALPFEDGAAALALSLNVLMHVVELEDAIAELARILAGGGALVLGLTHPVAEAGTWDEERGELRLTSYFEAAEHALPLGEHHVFHQHRTIEQYVRAFLAAGFALEDLREVPGRTGGIPRYLALRFRT